MTDIQNHPLKQILENRIAILDGAMGTTIRTYGMTEADIRGERFKNATKGLLNNGDLRGTLARLMEQRYPVYAEADYTVISGDGPHDDVVEQILDVLPESYRRRAAG